MSFPGWLRNLRSALVPGRNQRGRGRRGSLRAAAHRLNVEALEDRLTPSLQLAGYYPGTTDVWPTGMLQLSADVTSDGIFDLIDTVNGSAIVVQPGRGDGTFGDPIYSGLWTGPDLVAADFNGDGRLDLFTVIPPDEWSNGAEGSAVFLGRGDGTFVFNGAPVFDYTSPTPDGGRFETLWFGVTDFDGDGRPDVLVSGLDSGSQESYTAVLQNDGNWPPVAPHSIVISDATVTEGNTGTASATFTVVLDAATTQTITVSYATADGTATAGSDYQAASGTLTFAPGEASKTISIEVNGDRLPEPNETFVLNLTSPTNATIADDQGVGTILDDEPRLSISDATVTEGNTGTASATFTVMLDAASTDPITVSYATGDRTATAGSDYQAASGTLTFAPGETSKTVSVLVNGDRLPEPNETFAVNLSGATNASIADGQGVGAILDDEPRLRIGDLTKLEGKKNQTTLFTFTVTLSAAYDQPVTVSFKTTDGTATTADGDYAARTGTLTFAPGETTKTITVDVKGDSKREATETFFVDLFGTSGNALLLDGRGVGTILNDD
jgi:hypothetical protein